MDGVQIGNSIPIARYLARKYDLVGDGEIEMAQSDMVIDCLHDYLNGTFVPAKYQGELLNTLNILLEHTHIINISSNYM